MFLKATDQLRKLESNILSSDVEIQQTFSVMKLILAADH